MTIQSPPSDERVTSLINRHIASSSDDADPESLFAELEAEDDTAFRATRVQ
jgi:hypothetical protein